MKLLLNEMSAAGRDRLVLVGLRNQLGATGAVGATHTYNSDAMVQSLVRNSAGLYTLTLRQKMPANSLIGWSIGHQVSGVTPTNKGTTWKLESSDVSGAGTIVFRCEIPATGAAPATTQDPPDSAVLFATFIFNRGLL